MGRTPEQFLEALNDSANTISELAWELGISRVDAEHGIDECVRRGWVVTPLSAAGVPASMGWAPYLMLTIQGEEALAEARAADTG
jgi:predicted DNA-binding transcriptional regulator